MNQLLTVEQALEQEGVFVTTTSGVSMEPLFRHRRDTVVVVPPQGRLKKYDVPLYRRGNEYVLHRVVDVTPAAYVICGDNCINKEFHITDNEIVGVMTEFYRKGKHYTVNDKGYRVYARLVVFTYPLRIAYYRCRAVAGRIYRALFIKK